MKNTSWVISCHDLFDALKKGKKKIIFYFLLAGALFLFWKLLAPLTYTAEGIYHLVNENPKNVLSKTLQSLGGMDATALYHDDLPTLLDAPPILKSVVQNLHLQAILKRENEDSLLTRMQHNLMAEYGYFSSKKFGQNLYLPSYEILNEKPPIVYCRDISHDACFFEELHLYFFEERKFSVRKQDGAFIGDGEIGSPFILGASSFTLHASEPCFGQKFTLFLLPPKAAQNLLKKHIKLFSNPQRPSLIHFQCKMGDKKMACKVVEEMMIAYSNFLIEMRKKKVSLQLSYLEKRKLECQNAFEKTMEEYQKILGSQIAERGFFNLENEVKNLNEKKKGLLEYLEEIKKEKSYLSGSPQESNLTLELARDFKHQFQNEFEKLEIEKSNLLYAARMLEDPLNEVTSAIHLVKDAKRGERIKEIEFNLLDQKNWSPKERVRLQDDLTTEKTFLEKFIQDEVGAKESSIAVLLEKIAKINGELIFLLQKECDFVTTTLAAIAEQMQALPVYWAKWQAFEVEKSIQEELLEQLSATIEERNLACHLNTMESTPLDIAHLPYFPNRPRLLFYFVLGGGIGAFGCILFIFLRQIQKGPTASCKNLFSTGHVVCQLLDELYFELKKRPHNTILFASKQKSHLVQNFSNFLKGREENWKLTHSHNVAEISYLATIADAVVFEVTDETLPDLLNLPSNTIFYLEKGEEKRKPKRRSSRLQKILAFK